MFTLNKRQLCDLEFNLRVTTKYGLKYIPHTLCHFRIHSDSTTTKNVQTKAFILSQLEPIILVNELLFSNHFIDFRKYIDNKAKFKLKNYFNIRSYEASLKALETENTQKLFVDVCNKFKEIKKASKGSLYMKLKYKALILFRKWRS